MSSRQGQILSVSVVSAAALFLAAQGIFHAAVNHPTFRVEELEVCWAPQMKRPPELYRLRPQRNIFQVDLQAVTAALRQRYPTAKVEVIRRVLPNRLVARMSPMQVLAQLKADRYYPVSQEGTVLADGRTSPWPHLPILFLEGLKGPYASTQTIRHPALEVVCELLAAITRAGGIAGHTVSSLKANKRSLGLFLDSGVEVRFSIDRLMVGWQQLADLVQERKSILEKSRYIDLRFEDPTIAARS